MALYVDIGIGIITLIALIVGIIKGFSKQFTKGLCGFIAFVGSIRTYYTTYAVNSESRRV